MASRVGVALKKFRSGKSLFARVLLVLLVSTIGLLFLPQPSHAEDDPRVFDELVTIQAAHWQLARWQDGFTVCNMYVAHNQLPTSSDVTQACGREILSQWLSTTACAELQNGGSGVGCSGLLMRYVGENSYSYVRQVELPKIDMWVDVVDCTPGAICDKRPGLHVIAREPLPDNKITHVFIRVGDREKMYDGTDAELKLPVTDARGDWLQFWSESDFGDQSQVFQVKYRAYQVTGGENPTYRFDLLQDEWKSTLPPAALLWEMFPPIDKPLPDLFEQPLSPGYLSTTNRYIYLAGHLIRDGLVDATSCGEGFGLIPNGGATPCGEQAAADKVLEWQNRYDQQIYNAALRNNIPARVLKGVIAQESQFWPSDSPYERGLGYVSEDGVAMLLLWNPSYYLSLCAPTYSEGGCAAGYANLREDRQTVMRGSVFSKVGTEEEIDMLGAMLYASAAQTKQLIYNVLRSDPSDVTTYEDMWAMSIANYYAGSGCLGDALRAALEEEPPITWKTISGYLPEGCSIATDYVNRVIEYSN